MPPGVPSVITGMRLAAGRTFTFFGIHPTPPIPNNYPDDVGLRNVVLQKVARLLRQTPGPVQDVSVGRSLCPTFDARIPLMRWPLDHFFVSPQFRVVSLTRPPDVGSDHFALLAELALARE